MNDKTTLENAQAQREARDAVATRPSSSGTDARQAALRRYLGAETYHEKKLEDAENAADGVEES